MAEATLSARTKVRERDQERVSECVGCSEKEREEGRRWVVMKPSEGDKGCICIGWCRGRESKGAR